MAKLTQIALIITLPKMKLSGLKICPNGPDRTESIVPGSKSTKTALGTYFPPKVKVIFRNSYLIKKVDSKYLTL